MGFSCSFAFGEAGVQQGDWKAAADGTTKTPPALRSARSLL